MAEQKKLDSSHMSRILRLTLLAPDIIIAILDGQQPESLTPLHSIGNGSIKSAKQRVRLGFPERE